MPRPPNPLTDEETAILKRFVGYDVKMDALVWLERKPEDFGTKDPVRTARGFNNAKAGEAIAVSPSGQFAVTTWAQKYTFTENKVRAFLQAPHRQIKQYMTPTVAPKSRTMRHPHARGNAARNTSPDGNMFDKAFIRRVIEMGPDKVLRWRVLGNRDDRDMIEAAVRERLPGAEYELAPIVTPRSMKLHRARRAGTEVQVTTAGVVRMFRVITIAPHVLTELFPGGRMGVTDADRLAARGLPPIQEADMRAIIGFDPTKGPVWKARGKAEWFRLVLLKAVPSMPDEDRISRWNAEHAGSRVPLVAPANRPAVYRIGARVIGMQKLNAMVG